MLKIFQEKRLFAVDLDGTLITQPEKYDCEINNTEAYKRAKPRQDVIDSINELYDQGHTIMIYTARGCRSKVDYLELTKNQLEQFGIKYHQLLLGQKPHFDYLIDDKVINVEYWRNMYMVMKLVNKVKVVLENVYNEVCDSFCSLWKKSSKQSTRCGSSKCKRKCGE